MARSQSKGLRLINLTTNKVNVWVFRHGWILYKQIATESQVGHGILSYLAEGTWPLFCGESGGKEELELIPHICLFPKVIFLKLLLVLVPSFFADITAPLRGWFQWEWKCVQRRLDCPLEAHTPHKVLYFYFLQKRARGITFGIGPISASCLWPIMANKKIGTLSLLFFIWVIRYMSLSFSATPKMSCSLTSFPDWCRPSRLSREYVWYFHWSHPWKKFNSWFT